uniref:Uncharacterized protein n=1 Tax=Eutreptiella gymnastica TaxID=73025 RepID=A0A7S4CXY2_9EUGL
MRCIPLLRVGAIRQADELCGIHLTTPLPPCPSLGTVEEDCRSPRLLGLEGAFARCDTFVPNIPQFHPPVEKPPKQTKINPIDPIEVCSACSLPTKGTSSTLWHKQEV